MQDSQGCWHETAPTNKLSSPQENEISICIFQPKVQLQATTSNYDYDYDWPPLSESCNNCCVMTRGEFGLESMMVILDCKMAIFEWKIKVHTAFWCRMRSRILPRSWLEEHQLNKLRPCLLLVVLEGHWTLLLLHPATKIISFISPGPY